MPNTHIHTHTISHILIDLSRNTGVYVKAHFIPETGFNKTALDGRFATDGKGVLAHVRGGADAHDATTLFWALASMGTGKNVATLLVDVNRDMERVSEKTNFVVQNKDHVIKKI